jgi:hypothetical protein
MANIQQITRDYVLRARTEGVAEVTAAAQRLGGATDALAAKTETVSKSQISAAAALDRLQRQLDLNYRSMRQFEQAQRDLDRAQQQGLLSTARHAELLSQAAARYGQATISSRAFAAATSGVSGQLIALSAGAGPVGVFLSALGPWGIAAAVGLGVASAALHGMADAAHALAEKAQELRRFAEVTQLTTDQVQALLSEASKFSVTSDEAQTAIQNFTARFNDLRLGQGDALAQIRRVNPALAEQMQLTTNVADALTLFGQALTKTDDIFQRNALVKAMTGKGGIANAQFLTGINVDQITQSFVGAGKGLDEGLIKRIAQLEIDIKKTSAAASQALASIFSETLLQGELEFQKQWLEFANSAKNFSITGDLRYLLETILKIKLGGAGTLLGAAGIDYSAGYKVPQSPLAVGAGLNDIEAAALRAGPRTGDPTANKTLEAQAADLKKLNEVLGAATTFQQHYNLALAELKVKARDAGEAEDGLNFLRAKGALLLNLSTQATAARVSQLGEMASTVELNKQKEDALQKAIQDGARFSPTELVAIRERNKLLIESSRIENQMAFDRQQIFKSQVDQSIDALLRANGIPPNSARADAIRDYMRMTDTLKQLHSAGESAFTGLVSDIASGVSAMDALIRQTAQLGKSLTDIGSKSLFGSLTKGLSGGGFSFDPVSLGVGVVGLGITAISSWLSGAKKADEEALKNKITWEGLTDQMNAFVTASKGFDLSPLASAVISARQTYQQLAKAALAANDNAGAAKVADAFAHTIWSQMDKFVSQGDASSEFAKKIKELQLGFDQLIDAMKQVNFYSDEAGATLKASLVSQIKAVQEQAQKSLIADINEATGKGFINELNNLFDRVSQLKSEASITGVDTSLIDRFLQVQAQKIVDGAGLVGDSFNDLIKLFPNLTGLVHESTDALKQQADAQKQLQNQLDQALRSIADYVNSLSAGPESTLSPTARLSAAQSAYNATLGLAQGNNLDALARITQDAENYRKALREVYASGTGYQSGEAAIKAQLLGLPAVATSTDPVVQALLNVQSKIDTTNARLINGGQTAAQLLSTSVVRLDTSIVKFGDIVTSLGNVFSTLFNGTGWLSSLNSLQITARDQLQLLNQQLAGSQIAVITLPDIAGGKGSVTSPLDAAKSVNNTMLLALNKIVANTWATAENTKVIKGVGVTSGSFTGVYSGVLAGGGWITGGIPGRDSVPVLAMPNEFMVNASATRALTQQFGAGIMDTINAGRLPSNVVRFPVAPPFVGASNDNSALIGALIRRIDQLEQTLARATLASGGQIVRAVRETSADEIDAAEDDAKRLAFAITQNAKDNKAA